MSVLYNRTAYATYVYFDAERLCMHLADGREISVPLEWFPRLLHATDEQRQQKGSPDPDEPRRALFPCDRRQHSPGGVWNRERHTGEGNGAGDPPIDHTYGIQAAAHDGLADREIELSRSHRAPVVDLHHTPRR